MKQSIKKRRARGRALLKKLRSATKGMELPAADKIVAKYGKDPYLLLVSCILSLRTRDTVSFPASIRLFKRAKKPAQMLKLTLTQIEKLIYPVGFYKTKAKTIKAISKRLIDEYDGHVPQTLDELLGFKGVGLKTANLVLSLAFDIPALIVDTHVHRIANLVGLVQTKHADQTEAELQKVIPKKDWIEFSDLVVMYGQNTPRKDTLKNLGID